MTFIFFFVFSIVVGFLQILIGKVPVVEAFLSSFLFVQVGLMGIYNFMGHYNRSDLAAETIGWEKGSPFQKEVAFVHLSNGVLGLLSPVVRGEFWTAGVLAYTIFMVGAAIVRFKEKGENSIATPVYNTLSLWLTSFVAPLFMIGLLVVYRAGIH